MLTTWEVKPALQNKIRNVSRHWQAAKKLEIELDVRTWHYIILAESQVWLVTGTQRPQNT